MIFLISEANRCIGKLDEVPNDVAEIENYAVRAKLALRFIVLRSRPFNNRQANPIVINCRTV